MMNRKFAVVENFCDFQNHSGRLEMWDPDQIEPYLSKTFLYNKYLANYDKMLEVETTYIESCDKNGIPVIICFGDCLDERFEVGTYPEHKIIYWWNGGVVSSEFWKELVMNLEILR